MFDKDADFLWGLMWEGFCCFSVCIKVFDKDTGFLWGLMWEGLCYVSVCFKVFDKDHDGQLNEEELTDMLRALDIVRNEYNSPETLVCYHSLHLSLCVCLCLCMCVFPHFKLSI